MASLKLAIIILVNAVLILAEGESEMQKLKVVPDVIDKVPTAVLEVSYPGGVKVDNGNVLTPTKVKDQPTVKWDGADTDFYTLAMVDPDAPSREDPKYREWHHWLVVNIPGNNIEKGEVLSAYIGSGPPKGTHLHRYVLLLYKQQGKEKFTEAKLTNTSGKDRGSFKIRSFAKKHNLGEPIAGNFFQAEWDDYVPTLYKQLGAK